MLPNRWKSLSRIEADRQYLALLSHLPLSSIATYPYS